MTVQVRDETDCLLMRSSGGCLPLPASMSPSGISSPVSRSNPAGSSNDITLERPSSWVPAFITSVRPAL